MSWNQYLAEITNSSVVKFLEEMGSISSIFVVIGAILTWLFGAVPILKRLGFGRWKRKIGVFASEANFQLIKNSLTDSGVFREGNVIKLIESEIEQAKTQSLIIVDWNDHGKDIEQIYAYRSSHTVPVIIFAAPGSINNDQMKDIANRPHTVVVNFRGRLLNDALASLLTS